MNKKIFILCIFFIVVLVVPFFSQSSFSKYVFDYSFLSAKIKIDKKPEIEVISVSNTNTGYKNYANKTHEIELKVKVKEKNIAINNFNTSHIKILVDNKTYTHSAQVNLLSNYNGELTYRILITSIYGNGFLTLIFPEGIIQDTSGQVNDLLNYNTNILIDNIAPKATCEELSIGNQKSKYVINSNEQLRPFDNWDLSNNNTSLSKIFSSPIYYPINITDYAGNISEVFIDVKNATNIVLYYKNYNGYLISELESSGEISGKQSIIDGNNNKTEIVYACLDGDIDSSILQVRGFDYTYWGENTSYRCFSSENVCKYGYSPSPTTWYDVHGTNWSRLSGKICIQLGGQGHNIPNYTCKGTSNPIPEEIAKQNLYGLSGIAFNLKDSSEYSIVYQIYVHGVGWLRASSDGEETTYSHDKPFSAIRVNIVPKSEKQHLINYWNTYIGTNKID